MEIQGRIKMLGSTQTVGSGGFRKRELVITTEEQYPQHLLVEFVQDKCDLLNAYQVGQQVKVSINLRGREWVNPQGETKYFNSIQGWRIESLQAAQSAPPQMPPVPPADAFEPASNFNEEEYDEFTFLVNIFYKSRLTIETFLLSSIMIWLTEELYFPDPLQTEPHGIVAAGGDLKPERLLMAYHNGIFPWYDDDQPILWWSPDPRMVLFLKIYTFLKRHAKVDF